MKATAPMAACVSGCPIDIPLSGDSDLLISSFGQDRDGEIYVIAYGNAAPIYRVMPFF